MSFGGVPPWAKVTGKDPRLERRRNLIVVSEERKVRLGNAEERQRERSAKAYEKAAKDKIEAAHMPFTTAPAVEVRSNARNPAPSITRDRCSSSRSALNAI